MDTTRATAERIDSAREAAGFDRQQLSDESGIAYATLWRKLNGRVPFNVEEIDAIGKVLGVPGSSLVVFEDAA